MKINTKIKSTHARFLFEAGEVENVCKHKYTRSRFFIHHRFTLIEMLVVIAIIAVLAAFLMPAMMGALEGARMTACANNLKQIGLSMYQYAEDNFGKMPHPNQNWVNSTTSKPYPWMINRYLLPEESNYPRLPVSFKCPLSNSDTAQSYGMNVYYTGKAFFNLKKPGKAIMLGDSSDHFFFPNRWTKNYRYRHHDDNTSGIATQAGWLNAIHGDMHIKSYMWAEGKITTPHDSCTVLLPK